METNEKVQFVCFETKLNKEQFAKRWEQYGRSLNSNVNVTLQQSEKNGMFSYIAQHRLTSSELEFKFSNEGRTSRIVQVPIKTMLAGGYSILQTNRLNNTSDNESKIFIFLSDRQADFTVYKKLFAPENLNIYEAYYENCIYSYILEYYVKTRDAAILLAQLKEYNMADIGIYKEYAHVKDSSNGKVKDFYVWASS